MGPTDVGVATPLAMNCNTQCTLANVVLPNAVGLERSPITGTITRWRASFDSGDGPVRLQVLKRTQDKVGAANDTFVAVRETVDTTVPGTGKQVFDADLHIRKGQFIGLKGLSFASGTFVNYASRPRARMAMFAPELVPGDSPRKSDALFPSEYVLLNASVRR